ncbi:MAG: ribosome biogenesis GTP-binding protein YihA/YsxC [Coxiellaceae bacterium]|nr:ribosome biogenesis GTP-binding protein YihA/YsxC [Coxiellaceae bacterium]
MTEKLDYSKAHYTISATDLNQMPTDEGAEVAFIGRSNAGKSSALNTIAGIKGLARVSKTPGRTQAINVFDLSKKCRLIDLPGYGYAKVPRPVKERWAQYIDAYLQNRKCLQGLVLIMDIRHPLKELDQQLIEWTANCDISVHILLTKADKLSKNQQRKTLTDVTDALEIYGDTISIQCFSSLDRLGVEEARNKLDEWFGE